MKTEGLTLQEAVQALEDGKATKARRPNWNGHIWLPSPGGTFPVQLKTADVLATDYILIDPVPEKRTVKGWVNIFEGDLIGSVAHATREDALRGRVGLDALGDPLYIEHEYEVKP